MSFKSKKDAEDMIEACRKADEFAEKNQLTQRIDGSDGIGYIMHHLEDFIEAGIKFDWFALIREEARNSFNIAALRLNIEKLKKYSNLSEKEIYSYLIVDCGDISRNWILEEISIYYSMKKHGREIELPCGTEWFLETARKRFSSEINQLAK